LYRFHPYFNSNDTAEVETPAVPPINNKEQGEWIRNAGNPTWPLQAVFNRMSSIYSLIV
jgi:hypothetical protein